MFSRGSLSFLSVRCGVRFVFWCRFCEPESFLVSAVIGYFWSGFFECGVFVFLCASDLGVVWGVVMA